MFYDVSQISAPDAKAYVPTPTRSSDDTGCQNIPDAQTASRTHGSKSSSPRRPAAVKLPSQLVQTQDYEQPNQGEQAKRLPRERWEQASYQASLAHQSEKEEDRRHLQRGSPHHCLRDPEKAYNDQSPRQSYRHSPPQSHHTTIQYEPEDVDEEDSTEAHSVWILIYLSCLSPFLALLFSLYTLLTTTILLLLHPICFFCTERRPLSTQFRYFLLPPIAFQLGLIYSDINIDKHATRLASSSSILLLIVNLLGPVYAAWVAASAWVAAGFWTFAAVMGDPDGRDGQTGKNDGRAAVMGVRRWWERWLERPTK